MKRITGIIVLSGLSLYLSVRAVTAASGRSTELFDVGWQFVQGDQPGAEQPQFDDHAWKRLDVPNDWSIAGPFAETNPAGGAGAFLPSDVAWYRKNFVLPDSDSGHCVCALFDGVMANSDIWINGVHLGYRPSGYVSFAYDLTSHLKFGGGQTNVLAVRADTSQQPASRWYAGAGIYRHVHLILTDPVHLAQWGVFVSTPQVGDSQATVEVQSEVTNQSDTTRQISLQVALHDPSGKIVATGETAPQAIAPGQSVPFSQTLVVQNPRRWDLDTPVLYQAVVKVQSATGSFDEETVPFGIREFHFDPATGFWLNGRNFKIKGVCLHACASAFGAAVPLSVWEQRLETLKALGANAIRTAHNPPAPEFLDLCDRMGFLVMDEMFDCWTVGKNPYDYHLYFNEWSKTDTRDTVRRDRNHPAIILYSAGNEIHDTPQADHAKKILAGLLQAFHENDPTRPVTMALFRPNVSHDYDDGLADMLDVVGQNYRENEILAAHEQNPARKIIGTENHPDRVSWLALRDHPPYAGQFLWTGIDYLGESRRWPVMAGGSGLLDRTAETKPIGYEEASWWSDQPMVFITRRTAPTQRIGADPGFTPLDRPQVLFPDWTPKDPAPHIENVEVYSNCKEVELFLNGKSLGIQTIHGDASPRVWKVNYEPGTLKAVARNDGTVVATDALRTAGEPAKIILTANRQMLANNWDEVAFVRAVVVDSHGVPVPRANNLISFKLSGPGVMAAVDSADNSSHEPFQAMERHAYDGRCVAYIKASGASGPLAVTASSPGLVDGEVTIQAENPVE